jgi:ComF family protein
VEIRRIEEPFCERCSRPFDGVMSGGFECPDCAGREHSFECAVAPFLSRGVVRECVHAFKYDHARHLIRHLDAWIAEGLADRRIAGRRVDAWVPVPLHGVRHRTRGFNQAEILCRGLAARSGRPVARVLRRVRATPTQTRLIREERMENLRGAFHVSESGGVKDQHLVLVDDVFTTGSTAEECSGTLRRAGAASVRVLCVARG